MNKTNATMKMAEVCKYIDISDWRLFSPDIYQISFDNWVFIFVLAYILFSIGNQSAGNCHHTLIKCMRLEKAIFTSKKAA